MRSIERRLFLIALLWTAAAILVVGIVLSALVEATATRALEARIEAAMSQLSAAIEIDDGDVLTLDRNPDEAGFHQPRSGWAWVVDIQRRPIGQSRSLAARDPHALLVRDGDTASLDGQAIRVMSREIVRDGQPSARITVAAPLAAVRAEVTAIRTTVAMVMIALALVLMLGFVLQMRWGLKPLNTLANDIERVRLGTLTRVRPTGIDNLEAIADATNRLIEALTKTAERSRADAANLAHAIKTPLSVIALRASEASPTASRDILTSTEQIRRQIDRRLRRSHAVAMSALSQPKTPLAPAIADAILAASKIYPRDTTGTTAVDADLTISLSRPDLDEVAGNLIDNAFKWARSNVRITAKETGGVVVITIEDDGPGIAHEDLATVLKRGGRLDEQSQGEGLGLAIVQDILADRGGHLKLTRSEALGGLRATVTV